MLSTVIHILVDAKEIFHYIVVYLIFRLLKGSKNLKMFINSFLKCG